MTSVRTTNSDHLDARNLAARDCLARLSLKPSGSAKGALDGALDGAWWPRSTDPTIELGTLIEAIRVPVRRIALNMAGWDSAPRRVWRSGRNVAVDWFQTSGVHLVRIVGTDDQRIDLLLIPVNTEDATADLALTMATDATILTSPPLLATTLRPWALRRKPRHSQTTKTAPRTAMPTTGPGQHPATSSAADALLSCRRTGPAE
jgi:hypothetical protein